MNAITQPRQPSRMAEARDWVEFLRPLLMAVANRPERDDYAAKCQTIAFAMPNVPADMLVGWRQRDALRRFKFFPSPAEIAEWLEPDLADRSRTAQTMALAAPRPEPRAERTPEEIAAVRATVQAWMAERNAAGGPAELPPVRPAYLTGEHLEQVRNACPLVKAAREHQARMAARQVPA